MRHEWEDVGGDHAHPETWMRILRQCKHCLKVQEKETEHLWMRVVGYRWLPLVGRCPGKPEPNELAFEMDAVPKNIRKA